MTERELESRESEIIHHPIREIVLTSNPPQYYCVNEKGERNPCYCHHCDWTGWDDYEEWLDRQPVSRGELKSALVNSADQARAEGRAEALAEVVAVLMGEMTRYGAGDVCNYDGTFSDGDADTCNPSDYAAIRALAEAIATVREMGES